MKDIVYNDRLSTFEELLNKGNSLSVHHRNLQCLATEIFGKSASDFARRFSFNWTIDIQRFLRFQPEFGTRTIRTVHYGTNFLRFLGPKIWEIVPSELNRFERVDVSKSKVWKWRPHNCPCRFCDSYIHQVGFI